MAFPPVLSPETWSALRTASIKGVPDSQLAESFGVEVNAIRQKRFHDPDWSAAIKATRELLKQATPALKNENGDITPKVMEGAKVGENGADSASLAKKVASTISQSSQHLSLSNMLLASQIAAKGLKRASGEIDSLPLESIADVERIFKMASIAGRWNAPQVQFNQAIAFGGSKGDEEITRLDTVVIDDDGQYDDSFGLDESGTA